MKCAACHDQMEQKCGQIELRIKGNLYLVENVVYQECPTCGERVLSPEVSQQLFNKIKNKEYKEKNIMVPVIDGCKAAAG